MSVQPIEFPTRNEDLVWRLRFRTLRTYTECLLGFTNYVQRQGQVKGIPTATMEAIRDLLAFVDKEGRV